ncbi:MAG: OmpA family protein [Alphaproteobacteria bacterium]
MTSISEQCSNNRSGLASRRAAQALRGAALAATLLFTGACSTMEALNPVSWFEEDDSKTAAPALPPQDASKYPNLASVPPRPVLPDITERKEALREGLVADTQNARYSDEVVRRDWSALTGRQLADSRGGAPEASGPPPVRVTAPVAPSRPFAAPATAPATAPEAPKRAPEPEALSPAAGAEPPVPPQPAIVPPPPVRVAAPPAVQPPAPAPVQTQLAARPPEPAPAPAPPARSGPLHVGTIYFPDGSSGLDGDSRAALNAIADAYLRAGGRIRVVGHSSVGVGAEETVRGQLANRKVSLDRANAVATELVRRGVPPSAVEVDGAGAERPAYAEISQQSEAWNRRAEVYFLTDG